MGGQLPDSVAQQHAEPERPKAALLGSRAASRGGARLAWALNVRLRGDRLARLGRKRAIS